MVFAGCEKLKNQLNAVQGGIKPNIIKILDSESDSNYVEPTILNKALNTSIIKGINDSVIQYDFNLIESHQSFYSPLRLDTNRGVENIYPQYPWNYLKPLWKFDTLNLNNNNQIFSNSNNSYY